jgi:hypothetical protein
MPRQLFTPGKDPLPIAQEAGWAPGPVWTGAENLASTWIRSPDRPAHSQSLYWLCYLAQFLWAQYNKSCILQYSIIAMYGNYSARSGVKVHTIYLYDIFIRITQIGLNKRTSQIITNLEECGPCPS